MRRCSRARVFPIWLAVVLATSYGLGLRVARAAQADSPDPVEEVGFEQEDDSALAEWSKSVGNRYLMGLNSLITFPADPVMSTVQPAEELDELPLAPATRYPVGFVQGTMLSMYRASMGALDLLFAPLTPMKMLSPEPRYMIFPDVTHEEY